MILRVTTVVGFVLLGNWLFDWIGLLVGAALGTIVVTQTEDVVRAARIAAMAGGTWLQIGWRTLRGVFGHVFVQRLVRAFVFALFVGAATAAGNELGGRIWAVIAASVAVALGQTIGSTRHATAVAEAAPVHATALAHAPALGPVAANAPAPDQSQNA